MSIKIEQRIAWINERVPLDGIQISYIKFQMQEHTKPLLDEIAKLKASKLEILNHIKSGFEVQSDYSTQCNGYKYLCREIEELKALKSEANEAVDFLIWIWLNKYTDNNDADELYEIFKTQQLTHKNKV